jgi:hypothetical protein
MEPAASPARPMVMTKSSRMITHRSRIRGLAAAGLLCAALAGCGTAAAAPAHGAGDPLSTAAAPSVGCASADQATTVTVTRHTLTAEPLNTHAGTVTQRNARLVRALFGDFCAAIAHAEIRQPAYMCPADFGTSYTGTFYDGRRVLATFVYAVSGCPRISVTAAGRTRGTLLLGTAAAAAPHLKADMAAVLGEPESQVYGSSSQTQLSIPPKQGA